MTMTDAPIDTSTSSPSPLLLAAVIGLFTVVSLVALGSGLGVIALPYEMALVDQQLPFVFRLHMVSAALALLLLPVVIGARHRPALHKRMGRLLGTFVVIGGLTALPVAIFSHSSLAARAGFFTQGVVWLALFATAIYFVRRAEYARHAQTMLAMAAVASGAVWFRLMTGSAIWLGLPFEATYALASWAGWLGPLALVWFHRDRLAAWAFAAPKPPLARPARIV